MFGFSQSDRGLQDGQAHGCQRGGPPEGWWPVTFGVRPELPRFLRSSYAGCSGGRRHRRFAGGLPAPRSHGNPAATCTPQGARHSPIPGPDTLQQDAAELHKEEERSRTVRGSLESKRNDLFPRFMKSDLKNIQNVVLFGK